jgi:hypothetical protein
MKTGLLAQMRMEPGPATPPPIRDIAPPVDVLPYPLWMIILVAGVALGLAAFIGWRLLRWYRNRPAPPPPSARSIALRELEKLRPEVKRLDPYPFSIAVSDILRTFIGGHYALHAREQTSPEFLAAIATSRRFTEDDRKLLARFLERVDMIKFARIDASAEENQELLSAATAFVHGGGV